MRFEITPDVSSLGVDAQLHFTPVSNWQPNALTREQIQEFNDRGFLTGIQVFDADEIAEHRRYFDALLEQVIESGGDSYSISTAHLTHGKVYDLLRNPRITAYVRDLIGPNVIGWGSHYFCKMPGDGKTVAWHQDAIYWPLTPSGTVTVWLAVDDADIDNACMKFLPTSHLHGVIEFEKSDESEGNVLNQSVKNVERFGDPVNVQLKAGEISIHSDLLLHGSEANNSNRRRCGLTLRYCSPQVLAGLDWNQKGVVVCGVDETGHWVDPPRPDED